MSSLFASSDGSMVGALAAVVGLVLGGFSLRWFLRAEGGGSKAVAIAGVVLGAALLGGGIWYGLVGAGYGREDEVEKREAGRRVKELAGRFEKLLVKCKAEVFPKMPYEASDEAKKAGYAKPIAVLKDELVKCYTGSEGVGQEKGAELKQIKWLVEKEECGAFAKRLIEERTFCPQMIEALITRAGFKDPLAAAEGGEEAEGEGDGKKIDPEKMRKGLEKLGARMRECATEVFRGYVPPGGMKPEEAQKKGVAAVIGAFTGCSRGEGGEELGMEQVEKLLESPDCKTLGERFRKLAACAPALEAPLKAGFKFDMKGMKARPESGEEEKGKQKGGAGEGGGR